MNMDLLALQIFTEVARAGSFAAVAANRGMDPSAVSRAISRLEADLGLRLFERTTRQMALTESGNEFLVRLLPALEQLSEAQQVATALSDTPSGVLRVTASTAFGEAVLIPMLKTFRQAYPKIQVQLELSDHHVDLIERRIDLAVRMVPEAPSDMIISKLMPTRYHVVTSPEYLRQHPLTDPSDLSRHECLRYSLPGFRSAWKYRTADRVEEVPISGAIEVEGALAMRRGALLGLGPALMANWLIARDLKAGRLIDPFPECHFAAKEFETAAWVITPSRRYVPQKTKSFIKELRKFVASID